MQTQDSPTPSLQDFSLIESCIRKAKDDYGYDNDSIAFYFFALKLILDLQDDEIKDSITDNYFLKVDGQKSGHDRGIDAVYINELDERPVIHLFNFKYAMSFNKTKGNFPASEIDKIVAFLSSLMQKDENLKSEVNPILYSKIEEIWEIFGRDSPSFCIHICTNYYYGFEEQEKLRFEREINKYRDFHTKFYLMHDFVKLVASRNKFPIDARFKAIDKQLFEKSDGDLRALVTNIDAKDLIRITLNDKAIRNKVDLESYEELKSFEIAEDTFEDNVRVYLKQGSKINQNIKKTAISDENHRFFYYNNGVTLTCKSFKYPTNQRSPIVELKDIQIVNGSQTIHALYEAFREDARKFDENIEVLCRIYETRDSDLSTKIAEYTNSQNPVKRRDIRSIDFFQQKLEQEFLNKGYYYERKKNQYSDRPKSQRMDSEKAGQVMMAFYNKMPSEAKNKKSLIFGEKYDEIFNDNINSDKVLLAYTLFDKIENEKSKVRMEILSDTQSFEEKSYILHASYYVLYIIGELAQKSSIEFSYDQIDNIWMLYPDAITSVKKAVEDGQRELGKKYSHGPFFKSEKTKKYFEHLKD
jgi:AIPR protein